MPNERDRAVERMAAEIDEEFLRGQRWDVAVEPAPPQGEQVPREMPQMQVARVWNQFWEEVAGNPRQVLEPRGGRIKLPVEGGKKGEELFTLILQGIREIYDTDAVIAGGAVRDVAASAPFHADVDVFIPLLWEKFAESLPELGWQGPTERIPMKTYAKPIDGMGFKSTARGRSYVQQTMVDLVFVDKPLSMEDVSAFPIHAQRGVFTLETGLVLSPEARADVEGKQFTIDASITDKDKVATFIEKIKVWQKRDIYKGWKIITPDLKEWWEEEVKVDPLNEAMMHQLKYQQNLHAYMEMERLMRNPV